MTTRTVLLTGAAGLVGRAAIDQFVAAGWDVVATDVDGRIEGEPPCPRVLWTALDVTTMSAEVLAGVDTVVHLGALTLSAEATTTAQTMLDVNVLGTQRLFQSAVASDVRRVVWASSAAVYGRPFGNLDGNRVSQLGPFRPISLYGHTKLMCEGLAAHHAHKGGTTFVGMRPTFSYGLGRLTGISGRFAQWIADAIEGRPAVLGPPFGASGRLQLMHVHDLARSLVACAELDLGDESDTRATVLNSPTRELLTIEQLVQQLIEVTDNAAVSVQQPHVDEEMIMPLMDTATATDLLGFEQQLPFRKAVLHMADELGVAL